MTLLGNLDYNRAFEFEDGVLSVGLRNEGEPTYFSEESAQNSAHGSAPDVEPAGDLGFANASAMQFPDLRSVDCRRCRPAQTLAVLPGVGQSGASSLTAGSPVRTRRIRPAARPSLDPQA